MDALFEFLFKYRPIVFEKGTLAFMPPWPWALVIALGLAAFAAGLVGYLRPRIALRRRDRVLLASLRAVTLAVVVTCLARPVLVLAEAVAQRNVVGVVVDDSRSMRIADLAGKTRADEVQRLLAGPDSALFRALSEKFQIRFFRTSGRGGRSDQFGTPEFEGPRTRLVSSLLRASDELTGAPVAGMVLVSDGADNSGTVSGSEGMAEQLLALRARRVPVFSIGVGSERFARDIEVTRVEAPRAVLREATLLVEVVLVQRGFGGTRVPVVIEDSGRIVASRTVELPKDGEAAVVRIRVPSPERGARTLKVKVAPQSGEQVTENNERYALVVVRDRKEKVLYVEGEPRWELKYLRRALEADENIQVVTLLRSAKDKFLRLSVDDSLELAAGFPRTREELFSYRAIVLGSVEAGFFTLDQLRMISDFVSERGGGLLALGGRRALAEGGYAGTPVADLLPFEIGPAPPAVDSGATMLAVSLTSAGATHPATQIGPNDSLTAARWKTMPRVSTVNVLGRTKPGATVLIAGSADGETGTRPVLVTQRFGRGKTAALTIQDSWLWQMEYEVAIEDLTHETFWRQVLRWLVSDVPDRVEPVVAEEGAPSEAIPIGGSVRDRAFLRANGARVRATVVAPGGGKTETSLDWVVERDGEYMANVVLDEPGVHAVRMTAVVGPDSLTSEPVYVRAATPTSEFFGAEMRPSLLRRLADETGGKYYDLTRATDVARDLVYSNSGATVVQRLDLWDMPILFFLLLGAVGGEWLIRRRRGLA